jgi:hypothetical protein
MDNDTATGDAENSARKAAKEDAQKQDDTQSKYAMPEDATDAPGRPLCEKCLQMFAH